MKSTSLNKNMKSFFKKNETKINVSKNIEKTSTKNKKVDTLVQSKRKEYTLNQNNINDNKKKWKQMIEENDTYWRNHFKLPSKKSRENPDETCCTKSKTPNSIHFVNLDYCENGGWIELKGLAHELYYNKCSKIFKFEKPVQMKPGGSDTVLNQSIIAKEKEMFKDLYKIGGVVSIMNSNGLLLDKNICKFMTNYKIRDYGGGGDCLFKSIAGLLNAINNKKNHTHEFVRNKIVNKMREMNNIELKSFEDIRDIEDEKNIERLVQAIDKQDNEYIENMGKPHTWGTILEIQVATIVFGINIHVFINGDDVVNHCYIQNSIDELIPISYIEGTIQKDNKYDILLFSNASHSNGEGNHYQGIIPKNEKNIDKRKVPFIDWKYLDGKIGSSKKRKKTKKQKKLKIRKNSKKRNTRKRKY